MKIASSEPKNPTVRSLLRAFTALCLGIASLLPASAAVQSQNLTLAYGWNAVWLEVEPVDAGGSALMVDEVFQSGSFLIDNVARPLNRVGTAEFISDPAVTFNQPGWLVWYANPQSGENDLFPVYGNQAYLVHASPVAGTSDGAPAGALVVEGSVEFFRPTWTAGAYNLLGFGVSGSPTFQDYLSAIGSGETSTSSSASPLVQRLDPTTGAWVGVDLRQSISPGQAYWVWAPYSLRTTRYTGPVSVQFNGLSGLDFGPGPGDIQVSNRTNTQGGPLMLSRQELTLSNLDPSASHAVTLRKIQPANEDLQLFALEPQPESLSWQVRTGTGGDPVSSWMITELAAGATTTASLGGYRNWSTGAAERENLYQLQIALESGVLNYWLPARAERSDLAGNTLPGAGAASPEYAGLWVGEVVLDSVTSLAESNDPVRAATSRLPMELLIHFDGTNPPVLLSHVMFLRTQSADESVPSEPVLVVDESKIPYFAGIEQRNGKPVGRRIETAGYDLPRMMDPTTQAALAQAEELTTTAAITSYVDSQSARPPQLVEDYFLTWALSGALGPNKVLRTSSTAAGDAANLPLTMDPFHRSNPFRHAYHPLHGAGYVVSRSFTVKFGALDEDGFLTGTYQETLSGLTASHPLTVAGTLTLQRVSNVAVLQ